MQRLGAFAAISMLFAAAPLSAQQDDGEQAETPAAAQQFAEPAAAEEEASTDTIVVTGDVAARRQVLVGSRIARKPTFVNGPIATSTGTRGLVPQSGMDQAGQYTRVIRTRSCISEEVALSEAAACIMADAQEAYGSGDLVAASEQYSLVSGTTQFGPEERLAAARWEYRIAEEQGDPAARETALSKMVETGAMEPAQEASARRSLVSMALTRNDRAGAFDRLLALDEAGMTDSRNLANLAILSRELGQPGAADIMVRAILLAEKAGSPVPKGWRDFAATQ